MKTNVVATQNAGKFKIASQYSIKIGFAIVTSVSLLMVSCANSDDYDLERTVTHTPFFDNPPIYYPDHNGPIETGSNIIYVDIDPDFSSQFVHDVYNLDLNNDGIIDFRFGTGIDPYLGVNWAEPNKDTFGVNALGATPGPFESRVQPLNKDFPITEGLVPPFFYDQYGGYMDFGLGAMDKYVALRFLINEKVHYGWARLDVISNYQWAIKDYAYNAAPGKPMYTGQMD